MRSREREREEVVVVEWVEGQDSMLRLEREGGRRKMRRTEIEMAGGKQRQVVCEEVCVLMRVQG